MIYLCCLYFVKANVSLYWLYIVKQFLYLHHLYVVNFHVTLSLYDQRSVFWFF